jgi:inward rectifier potassium channel
MATRKRKPTLADAVVVVGATPHPIRDLYHWLLKAGWMQVLAFIVALFLGANALYALVFLELGGIANAAPGSFADAFFFSVQTMGTIGYGAMYPTSRAAHLVVTSEAVVGLLVTALATGLVFARFSQPRASVIFSSRLSISPVDGVPTLMARLGNDRNDAIVNAEIHLTIVRTVKTKEGATFYRSTPLKLLRDRATTLSRTWNVMHVIDADSPLYGITPQQAIADELEVGIAVFGTDEVTHQSVHASERYLTAELIFGARPVDLLRELPDGRLELDVRRFDALEPTPATEAFPYSWTPPAS